MSDKVCDFCGTVNDYHHSAECVDRRDNGNTETKEEMRIPHIEAWSCSGNLCLRHHLSCVHTPDPVCRPVRAYDERVAALMTEAVGIVLDEPPSKTKAEHEARIVRFEKRWAKGTQKTK